MALDKFVEQLTEAELFAALKLNSIGIGENEIADAKNGKLEKQYKIAQTYYEKDMRVHARAWANKLVAKGHVMSIVLLGQLHFEGNDVRGLGYHPLERDTAEKLFNQACQKDQIKVPLAVAEYFQKGGMSQKAAKFYTIAGDNGNLKAQVWLGDYYNVAYRLDQHKALEWFEKSAAQSHTLSIQRVKELNDEGVYSSQTLKNAMEKDEN